MLKQSCSHEEHIKCSSARAELRVEQNLSPAAEGDCVFVLLFARVPSGQGGASSLIIALSEELLLLRLFLWFWVYLFLLNCYCGWAGDLAFRCYLEPSRFCLKGDVLYAYCVYGYARFRGAVADFAC